MSEQRDVTALPSEEANVTTLKPSYPDSFCEDGLWSEVGDRVWLRLDYGEDATRVKRKFFLGIGLPTTPGRDGAWYSHIKVERVFIRPGYPWEHGWAGSGDDTWWYSADSREANAWPAWEVSFRD